MSAILPNELLWKDGELWDYCSPPWKWVDDGSAQGLYCQQYPPSYLERLLIAIDRRSDRREALKLETNFEDKFEQRETSMLLINHQMSLRARKRRPPMREWVDDLPDVPHFKEVPKNLWWKEIHFMSFRQRQVFDDYFAHEVARGEWD